MKKYLIFLALAVLLLVTAIGWDIYQRQYFSNESLANQVRATLAVEVVNLQNELDVILKDSTASWSTLVHSFFLLDQGEIRKWSSNEFPITALELGGDYEWKILRISRSEYLVHQKKISKTQSLVGIILLHRGYGLTNRYLIEEWNKKIFPFDQIKILSSTDSEGALVCLSNHCLFRVIISNEVFISDELAVLLTFLSLIIILVLIFIIVSHLHHQQKYILAFVALFISLSLMRMAMVRFSFPSRWIYWQLFDPKYFASSSFNVSTGDFFLNSIIVFIACAYLFKVYSRIDWIKPARVMKEGTRILVSTLLLTAAYFSFLFPPLFIESIFHDSLIPFDITADVSFNLLRIVALLAFILGCLSSFFFVHFLVRIAKSIVSKNYFFGSLILAAFLFLSYFLFSELNYWATWSIGTVYILFLFFSGYYKSLALIGYRTFPVLVIVIVLFAIQGAVGVWRFMEEKKLKSMFRSASNLFNNDVLGEYLLQQASEKITNDSFIAASVDNPLLSKNEARQKIRQLYLSDYFNRYTVVINLYHADGSAADSESATDFATAIKTVQDEAYKTAYEGIYLIQNENAEMLKHYLAIIPLKSRAAARGYVIIDLFVKHIAQQQVYPSLLVDSRFAQSLRSKEFSYATYNKGRLIDHFGNFNFEREFDVRLFENPLLYSNGIHSKQFWLIGLENETGNRIVLAVNAYSLFNVLANFSFFFSVGILVILLTLVLFFAQYLIKKRNLNFSARIQVFAYMAFVIPLLAVSAIALRMINQSNESQLEKEIQEKGLSIAENLSIELDGKSVHTVDVKNKLAELAQTSGTEMNLYDAVGEIAASSQPAIFKAQLISAFVNRTAWEKLVQDKFYTINVPCHVGLLDYNSYFFAIKSKNTEQLLGILELPFFEPTSDLAKASILSNILVTFASVFILFSFVSLSALGKLTSPLRFIAKKLNATSLSNNQRMDWNTNDEVGRLVKEYNRMLDNLEQSKSELVRREKESAWREIAQQVAHEIKNPLTPMKLTLQQLEQLMATNDLTEEKTRKSLQTLLLQVETLNEIATAFSGFAAMPAPELGQVEVSQLLHSTISLFENNLQSDIYFHPATSPVFVQGDSKLLGRIFSNIILNGLQSGAKNRKAEIKIDVTAESDHCIVSFQDNGTGIPLESRDKIFLPHFSTKQTGSGLGLAIVKQGVEQMGGSIWFVTSNQGTCFFIKLKAVNKT